LLQRAVPIGAGDDAGSLGARLADTGGELLVETLDALAAGTVRSIAQDGARATWAPPIGAEDRVLAWEDGASSIVRRIRAMAPAPGAATSFRARRLKVLRATVASGEALATNRHAPSAVEPGTIVSASARDGLVVAAGSGAVELVEVAPEGRGRMSGSDFFSGARPQPGERLGG
jgi:methionyl-tRNA formyltransferase